MSEFKKTQAEQLHADPFTMIGKEWMLVTAKKQDGSVNTMTASWGGVGILWNKKVAFVFIRPQRYTKTFIDDQPYLTLSFYDESYRKQLSYFGTVSGRTEDKVSIADFHTIHEDGYAYFAEANTVLLCKKLYQQSMDEACFLDTALIAKNYVLNDYHMMYIVEINDVLTK